MSTQRAAACWSLIRAPADSYNTAQNAEGLAHSMHVRSCGSIVVKTYIDIHHSEGHHSRPFSDYITVIAIAIIVARDSCIARLIHCRRWYYGCRHRLM